MLLGYEVELRVLGGAEILARVPSSAELLGSTKAASGQRVQDCSCPSMRPSLVCSLANNDRNLATTFAVGHEPQECNPMNNIIYLVGLVVVVLAVLAFFGLR